MKSNNLIAIALLCFAGYTLYPRIEPYLSKSQPSTPVTPVTPLTVTPDAKLIPIAAPITASLTGNPKVATDFADFYLNLKDSLQRDTQGKVYPSTERFLKVHSTALTSAYQSRPDYQKFGIGATIDKTIETSLGGLESKPITEVERKQIIAALDTIIYTLLQVK